MSVTNIAGAGPAAAYGVQIYNIIIAAVPAVGTAGSAVATT